MSFVRLMNEALRCYLSNFVQVNLGKIVIFSKSFDKHLKHWKKVLERLKPHELTCHPIKCDFGKAEIASLGHVVNAGGIWQKPEKLIAIENFTVPTYVKKLQSFSGICN